MKTSYLIFTALVTLTLLATACSPQPTPTAAPPTEAPTTAATAMPSAEPPTEAPAMQEPTATEAAAMSAESGPAMVDLGKTDMLGSFLVDSKGMTLYLFKKDSPNTSACYNACATNWPPLLTTGSPVAGNGVDASKFGTTTRTDGTTQVTYNSWPLYYYAKDKQPGDTVGEGVGSAWYVVSPTGQEVVQH
jgi:predicted lipoprotein with Yx(FWY)xxD motif